jgi:hypothetical protein
MEVRIQQIPIAEITIPDGQRELGNLDGLIDSIQRLGLLPDFDTSRDMFPDEWRSGLLNGRLDGVAGSIHGPNPSRHG